MIISALRTHPHFADKIAHRGWTAWWTESGVPLAEYRAHLEPMINGSGIPQAFVAHECEAYLGSALLIACDLDARPQLTPWVAALWVEEAYRGQRIAAQLMDTACAKAHELGYGTAYLCAEKKVAPYYLARGWARIEADVGGLDVFETATRGSLGQSRHP